MLSIFDISYFKVFILKSPSWSFNPLRKARTKRRDVLMSQDEETASRLVSHFFAIKNLPAASKWSPKESVCLDRKKKTRRDSIISRRDKGVQRWRKLKTPANGDYGNWSYAFQDGQTVMLLFQKTTVRETPDPHHSYCNNSPIGVCILHQELMLHLTF